MLFYFQAEQFGDIVQGGFIDAYSNMTYKNIFGKLWVSEFCPQAKFVIKSDDDMFIDMFALHHLARCDKIISKLCKFPFLYSPPPLLAPLKVMNILTLFYVHILLSIYI